MAKSRKTTICPECLHEVLVNDCVHIDRGDHYILLCNKCLIKNKLTWNKKLNRMRQ